MHRSRGPPRAERYQGPSIPVAAATLSARLRHAVALLAINVGIFAALGVLAEGTVRIIGARRLDKDAESGITLPMCEPDAARVWRYMAGFHGRLRSEDFDITVATNAERLRGPMSPRDSTLTVLFIGDSFTFGWGVEESERFSEQLGVALGRSLRRPVAIVNAGHWGYSYDQQLLLLREVLPRVRPALVIQGFYWPHVLTLQSHRWRVGPESALVAVEQPGARVDKDGNLRRRSEWVEEPPFHSLLLAVVARPFLNWRLARSSRSETGDLLRGSPSTLPLWRRTDQAIAQTAATLRQAGVAWLPFLIPTAYQLSPAELRPWEQDLLKGADPDGPLQRLREAIARVEGAPVDLLPAMRERYTPHLYFDLDPHWRSGGHALAAELLFPETLARLNGSRLAAANGERAATAANSFSAIVPP